MTEKKKKLPQNLIKFWNNTKRKTLVATGISSALEPGASDQEPEMSLQK